MKNSLFLLLFILLGCKASRDNVEKVSLYFDSFKTGETEFIVDYKKNELTCIRYGYFDSLFIRDTAYSKIYRYSKKLGKELKKELNKNIPDSVLSKSEWGYDGPGFIISYIKKNNDTSKIKIFRPSLKSPKYSEELKKINSFFEFAYSTIKDTTGVQCVDMAYRPYSVGLPIRKISDNPLEYKIWGNISGDLSWHPELTEFLDSLKGDKCVIIDCNMQLSYAIQMDILKLYVINDTNLKFVNNDYFKHVREKLLDLKAKLKDPNEDTDKLKKSFMSNLYMSNPEQMDNWLKLPETSLDMSVQDARKSCK